MLSEGPRLVEEDRGLKEYLVEDAITHIRFPSMAAGDTLDWQGKKFYFVGEETRRENDGQSVALYVGATGLSIGMRSFGASAPRKDLLKKFGFTAENVVAAAPR